MRLVVTRIRIDRGRAERWTVEEWVANMLLCTDVPAFNYLDNIYKEGIVFYITKQYKNIIMLEARNCQGNQFSQGNQFAVFKAIISNCSGNGNLLKRPTDEVCSMLTVKKEKSWGHRNRLEDMTSAICHLFPHMAPS